MNSMVKKKKHGFRLRFSQPINPMHQTIWLVVWNMTFIFPRLGMMIQSDELIFFKMVKTTN